VFESVVVIAFQSTFCSEMLQNNIFFKKLFLTSAHQNNKKKNMKNIYFKQKKLIF
jgi:hypothetical protein